jgi:hypothetical protein
MQVGGIVIEDLYGYVEDFCQFFPKVKVEVGQLVTRMWTSHTNVDLSHEGRLVTRRQTYQQEGRLVTRM